MFPGTGGTAEFTRSLSGCFALVITERASCNAAAKFPTEARPPRMPSSLSSDLLPVPVAPTQNVRPENRPPAVRPRRPDWGDALFGQLYRRNLVYNICWEDPALDHAALDLQAHHRVLVITSAGCNALDYALAGPREIIAVDANPRQNALLELKLAGIRTLDHDDFFAVFGCGWHPRFTRLYRDRLRGELSGPAREFWDHRVHWFRERSPLHDHGLCGVFSRIVRHACRIRRGLWRDIEALFETATLAEQAEHYDRKVRPGLWNPAIRWMLSRQTLLALVGVPEAQRHLITSQHPGGVAGFVEEAIDRLFRTVPARTNYFWYFYAFGRFSPTCCPRYLTPAGFARLKAGPVNGIRVLTDTVTGALARQTQPVDRFVLLDHLDWMDGRDPVALEEEWTQLRRCAPAGARVLFRSAHRHPPFRHAVRTGARREPLHGWLRFHDALAADLHRRDRVHTYASFHIGEVHHG